MKLPIRQVHLDFHTSPHITGVGSRFDKTAFQEALKLGRVQSITLFAKCHHGYCYYPTKVGTPHPGLAPGRDFTGEMIDACHQIGVRAAVYIPIGWSALDAEEHPEWVMRDIHGNMIVKNCDIAQPPEAPRPEVSWLDLCSAGGYRQYLFDLTEEICQRYSHLDGLFFDIAFEGGVCCCESCLAGMKAQGLDPLTSGHIYYDQQKKLTVDGLSAILHRYHPDATVFFNTGGANILRPQWHYASTHFEMEDLPTVWGGYDKLPMRACFFGGLGKPLVAMTGKFHRAWGEFGGYKTPEALTQECAAILAYGASVSVGDQMHPDGSMDLETYRNIGSAYEYVQSIEAHCFDGVQTARLGVFISPEKAVNNGMALLLLDSGVDFDVIRCPEDLSRFDTVILPDRFCPEEEMAQALQAFPGKVMLLGGSGLGKQGFAFPLPFTYLGGPEYDMDYFQADAEGIVSAPVLCYRAGHRIAGGEALARIYEPYFSRTYGKYCSHFNTPYRQEPAQHPAAAISGQYLYAAHELAGLYARYGSAYHRRYFLWLLRKLYHADPVQVELPVQGRFHMIRRQQEYVLHILYAPPIQRGEVSILEDFPPLTNVPVRLRTAEALTEAFLIPQQIKLPLTRTADGWQLTIPKVQGHQTLVIRHEA